MFYGQPKKSLVALFVILCFVTVGCFFYPFFIGGEKVTCSQSFSAAQTNAQGNSAKININTADSAALEALPNIGPVRTQAIIQYRERTGRFASVSQLLCVEGIGAAIYGNIKDLCTV